MREKLWMTSKRFVNTCRASVAAFRIVSLSRLLRSPGQGTCVTGQVESRFANRVTKCPRRANSAASMSTMRYAAIVEGWHCEFGINCQGNAHGIRVGQVKARDR